MWACLSGSKIWCLATKKSQETAFPTQCVHLCCNLFRETHPQLLPGRWVSSCYGAAMLWLHHFLRWKGFYAVFMNNKLPCHKLLSSSKLAFEKPNTLPIVSVGKTKSSGIFLQPLEEKPPWVAKVLLEWHLRGEFSCKPSSPEVRELCTWLSSPQRQINTVKHNEGKKNIIKLLGVSWIKLSPIQEMSVPVSWWPFAFYVLFKNSHPVSSTVFY